MDVLLWMKDDDVEYVVGVCMCVVEWYYGVVWVCVWLLMQDVCMFDDIDMGIMFMFIGYVIMENFGFFI